MPTDAIGGIGDLNYVGTAKKEENTSGLTADMDTFLTLLVAQMQYQDPLEPKTDTDFVAQLAQLTSLEQLQQVNQSLATSQAYGLVGKNIYAEVLNSLTGVTEVFVGKVESIAIQNGTSYAIVGDNAICVDDILIVTDEPFEFGIEGEDKVEGENGGAEVENGTENPEDEHVDGGENAEQDTPSGENQQ
ncbi:MAG: hypothetical protein IKZ30_03600 [Oscillospiraceae bacterium]|nr:hypothetical protein [Oscillospiraceae bacterium]